MMVRVQLIFRILAFLILALSLFQIVRGSTVKASEQGAEEKGSIAEGLEKKRKELEAREKANAEYEAQLNSQKAEIEKRIEKIQEIRNEISGDLEKRKQVSEEKIMKMVSVFETMTPKAASQILEAMDDDMAVELINRIEPKRVAKIMNVMDKTRSARLSEKLTGFHHPESDRKIASQSDSQKSTSALSTDKSAGQTPSARQETGSMKDAKATGGADALNSKKGGSQ